MARWPILAHEAGMVYLAMAAQPCMLPLRYLISARDRTTIGSALLANYRVFFNGIKRSSLWRPGCLAHLPLQVAPYLKLEPPGK
jgi:hypothetical protein